MRLYKEISVWRRLNEKEAIRYNCLELLDKGTFVIQSADHYHYPLDDVVVSNLFNNYIELFIEEAPENRSAEYSSIEEAIAAFEDEW